jgi:hypothetical protein
MFCIHTLNLRMNTKRILVIYKPQKSILLLSLFIMIQLASAAGIQYLYPKPGAAYVPPETRLILRLQDIDPKQISHLNSIFKVNGEKSGQISGKTMIISDGRTIHFKPDRLFQLSEKVIVQLKVPTLDTTYFFQISSHPSDYIPVEANQSEPKPLPHSITKMQQIGDAFDPVVRNGISIPSDFPWMQISINDNPDSGYIFLNNWDPDGGQPYNMILDNAGNPIWYLKTPDRRRDFKVQKNGKLSMLIRGGYDDGYGHIVLDSTYTVVDVLRAGDGYATDEHELQILADGHYFVIGIRGEQVDMSQIVAGGRSDATVYVCALQEFTPDHELILVVPAWDLYDIREMQLEDLTGSSIRFPHMNAIDIDDDGNILVSSRHMSEVTKLNREDGSIIWRLGGAHSDFTFENDELDGFRSQHDIRVLGNNHYTVFDNGNLHNPPVSRSVEYLLDTTAMTATLFWQFRDIPDKYTSWMGNTQRLPNGNTLINWADESLPKLTEVRPNGEKAFEMDFVDNINCYRLFRFPWQGVAKIPYLIIESHPDRITLLFNKFGDTTVDHYNIYGDTHNTPTTLLATSTQPFIHLSDLENGALYYFRVKAVDNNGSESEYSNEEEVLVHLMPAGENMLFNGDFSDGIRNWHLERSGGASANMGTQNGVFLFLINIGGSEIWNVQLYQQDLTLIEGMTYTFEFDAWASSPRIIEAKVGKASDPFTNYSQIGMTYITQKKTRYRYPFTMANQTDQDCRVVFNCGIDTADVYLDNVSLVLGIPDAIKTGSENNLLVNAFALEGNYPNPFNNSTKISFSLPVSNPVKLKLYDITGRFIKNILNRTMTAGRHEILFNADNLSSGIYFIQLQAADIIYDTLKITYIK